MYRPIIIAVSIYITLALIVGLIVPRYKEINNVKKNIEITNEELSSERGYTASLKDIEKELEKYQGQLLKIDSALPAEPSVLDLFSFIEQKTQQNSLSLKEVRLGQITPSKIIQEIREINLSFSCAGSYPAFKSFLSNMEKSSRLIHVDSISFQAATEKSPPIFDLKIRANSY